MLDREMWDMFLVFTWKAKWITSNWTVYFAFERGLVFAENKGISVHCDSQNIAVTSFKNTVSHKRKLKNGIF